jgi:hypothetical protein
MQSYTFIVIKLKEKGKAHSHSNNGGALIWPAARVRSQATLFVVDNVTLGHVFSKYFSFSYQFSFHQPLHIHHHLSQGVGTSDQRVADVPSGLNLTPTQEIALRIKTCSTKY